MNSIPSQELSQWLTHINDTVPSNKGETLLIKGAFEIPLRLEWMKTDIQSPYLAAFRRYICEMACESLAPVEVEFLRQYPEAVNREIFLVGCAPFFAQGPQAVDWEAVEEKIKSTIKQFYLADISSFGIEVIKPLLNDVYCFATLRNEETKKLLGFTLFSITPALPYGDIKIINLVVDPSQKNQGLETLLLSMIFKIIPKAKRLFLFNRPTDTESLQMYQSLGFNVSKKPNQDPNHQVNPNYLILLEYQANQSDGLQKVAEKLNNL